MKNKEIFNKWTEFINDPKYKKYFLSNEEDWIENLNNVIDYINKNNKRPSKHNNNNQIKQLGHWIVQQQINYNKKEFIMKNKEIYNEWTIFINDPKYKKYFLSNEEDWIENLNQVKKYIDENNKRPSKHDNNNQIKQLGVWISTQQTKYNKKEYIMKNKEIYNEWTEFINDPKYKKYFLSNEEEWIENLYQVKKYIDKNDKKPTESNKDIQIKQLGVWISAHQTKYKKKEQIISNKEIYNKWTEFINDPKYKKYFLSNEEVWIENLYQVKKYIDENNKRPSNHNKDMQIKQLGEWISTQQTKYNKKEFIMKNKEIYDKWIEFINDENYKKYFLSNEEEWIENLYQVKKYIDKNNKRPSNHDKDIQIKQIGVWISTQQTKYKKKEKIMSNEEIYNKWTEFINDPKYKKYI
jgi:hypothetical protein